MDLNFTLDEIDAAAEKLLTAIGGSRVIALHGEMGAGKTTFVHALCRQLGVGDAVSSPTFSIINEYRTAAGEPVFHIDLYRLKDAEEAMNAGVEDCICSGHLTLVEWPEKAPGLFPDDTVRVSLTALDANTRKLQINL
ncbi:MAG: tRNA (adenosine(37)-N6)-threonylcarbamoyltransferase complex ATPase subunit type 1 TsaE [Ferruginibacter sp.]